MITIIVGMYIVILQETMLDYWQWSK